MKSGKRSVLFTVGWLVATTVAKAEGFAPIPRLIPPPGISVPAEKREPLEEAVAQLSGDIAALRANPPAAMIAQKADRSLPDVEVYVKAVRYALENEEFYDPKQIDAAFELLKQGRQRLDQLRQSETPWTKQKGLLVRGFRSRLDNSVQPFGLVIPDSLALDGVKKVPLYVWLHGRGEKELDLQFILRCQKKAGELQPSDAIVVHPFGRYCNGFKWAGEVDVLEAVDAVCTEYPIDRDRIVLAGFSMGGAGSWHLGAHYPDRWAAVAPGAGFAETARYQKLTPDKYPPAYVQTLWGLYDIPGYVRNFFQTPVLVYSGENDPQMQAARVMEEAFKAEGRSLDHIIGPGMGHKYHPDSLKKVQEFIHASAAKGIDRHPKAVSLQTRTLRYPKNRWVEALGLKEHWLDSRIDAAVESGGKIVVATKNIHTLAILPPQGEKFRMGESVAIDNQNFKIANDVERCIFTGDGSQWTLKTEQYEGMLAEPDQLAKKTGLQGPIDDVFMDSFLVVLPTGVKEPAIAQWVDYETEHFRNRWRRLFRGDALVKKDVDVSKEDIKKKHLILWGSPRSNLVLQRIASQLPIQWTPTEIAVGNQKFDSEHHVVSMIYPNPENRRRYVVLNSGTTFREDHDKTNSQQNPKLPDWAIIDIRQPPDGKSPGKIVLTDFFDEKWRLKP